MSGGLREKDTKRPTRRPAGQDGLHGSAATRCWAFDRMWLPMMIDLHKGAITMSNTELASGMNTDAKAVAGAYSLPGRRRSNRCRAS
ncbi:DUF305 domain-containing protein [Nocardia miyunensis]|uniref:DUF305 domain-containing protein n=1 Tax=Nocardia miyunensis TaxID=282684 RepID=UPI0009FCB919